MANDGPSAGDKMAAMRTALAFTRTHLAGDRTLMAVQRTALSLIGFGFTIYSFFSSILKKSPLASDFPPEAPRRFGLTLIILGVLLLMAGITSHVRYMSRLGKERASMAEMGVSPGTTERLFTPAVLVALLLLLAGLLAIASIVARIGPFG